MNKKGFLLATLAPAAHPANSPLRPPPAWLPPTTFRDSGKAAAITTGTEFIGGGPIGCDWQHASLVSASVVRGS